MTPEQRKNLEDLAIRAVLDEIDSLRAENERLRDELAGAEAMARAIARNDDSAFYRLGRSEALEEAAKEIEPMPNVDDYRKARTALYGAARAIRALAERQRG